MGTTLPRFGLGRKSRSAQRVAATRPTRFRQPIAILTDGPLVDDARGATLPIGIVGLAMCIVGGSGSTIASRNAFTVPASVLGGAALLLMLAGLISGWALAVPLLAADTLVLWTIDRSPRDGEPAADPADV